MSRRSLATFPHGAVYFRKSNPPREDWVRDYQTAAADGLNTFRHWFLWSAIETAPGVYDWADYDRQLDLAAENGITTIIAEMITSAPEWAFVDYAHARYLRPDGRPIESQVGNSAAVGGFPGLCLDNPDYRELAGRFLAELVNRYRDHPGLGGYDVWNECGMPGDVCHCPATATRFREWLNQKHGDLAALGAAWHRHSFGSWMNVVPPAGLAPFPHVLDWLQFRVENAYEQMRWRVDLIRSLDASHPITAHGVAGGLTSMASRATDDWRAAAEVESYGFTWVACRKGDEPWKHFHAADLTRAASRGKRFWHSEAQAGPLWMQPQVPGRSRDDGRIPTAQDVRYWMLTSMMCGATGYLYPRWRPLLDGPLWGAFGAYGMDGSRTPRSEMSSLLARWANAPEQALLWQSRPMQGEVGIVCVPETQLFALAQQGHTDYYANAMQGAYRGFFDQNIQADWVHANDVDAYDLLYLPYPVMLGQETADILRRWVAAGGTLICEGCPGYFDQGGHMGTVQPNLGLDHLFGALESYVEFTPDLLGDLVFSWRGSTAYGGLYRQAYEPITGHPAGLYEDGRIAAVEHSFGQGRTLLIGTMAGWGYGAHAQAGKRLATRSTDLFSRLLEFGCKMPHVTSSDPRVRARLHHGEGGTHLWIANPASQSLQVDLNLSATWGPFHACRTHWGTEAKVSGRRISLTCEPRDIAVLALE